MNRKFDHSGSTLEAFLEGEGVRDEAESVALKRVIAWELGQSMLQQHKSKSAMAKELRTSRTQLDRLLDPTNTAVSLSMIARAARAIGKRMKISFPNLRANRLKTRSLVRAG